VRPERDFVIAQLTEEGTLSAEDADRAIRHGAETKVTAAQAAVDLGLISAAQAAIAQAAVSECTFVDLRHYEIDLKNAALLARSAAEKRLAFPLFVIGKTITVGMADPTDLAAVDRLRSLLHTEIETVLCEATALRSLIERAYSMSGGIGPAAEQSVVTGAEGNAADEEPIVAAVNQILAQAIERNASDVHIGPDERDLHLRYRIDGVLHPCQGPPLSAHPGLVQRLKVMANLDLTQSRRPQDGKFRYPYSGRLVDMRLSIIPTVCGENVVIRVLGGHAAMGNLSELGFNAQMAQTAERMLSHPHGMILVTGPTGSGKTTTLYSFLARLNTPDKNVITIEDPVEIRMPLVRQVQVNTEIGMTFAGALRSILRQDPDVVLLGEIRDEESARIAIQASLTGHLVLSTLHTNDAAGAVARLRDFGCPSFAIAGAVLGVIAQRLVRRVCASCSAPCVPDAALLHRFNADGKAQFRRGAGCPACLSSGYRGRLGVYEMFPMSPRVQLGVERGASTPQLRRDARDAGMRPMWEDGLDKARLGITTLEEVLAVAAGTLETDLSDAPDGEGSKPHDSVRLSA
jgi:type IV pilus assembly protein PilB